MLDELGLSFEALLECGDPVTVFEHGSLCPRCMLNRVNFGFLFSYFRVLSYISWISCVDGIKVLVCSMLYMNNLLESSSRYLERPVAETH